MNIVYDCEILRCIPPKGVQMMTMEPGMEAYYNRFGDGFQYAGGWDDFENLGISVIAAMNLEADESHIFLHPDSIEHTYEMDFRITSTIYDFEEFAAGAKLFGFNSKNFDDRLLQANNIGVQTEFDLLEKVRLAAYGSIDYQDCPKGYTYKLDAIAQANGLGGKTGSGEQAPKLWQQGKQKEVIDYCLHDVKLTKQLILKFLSNELIDPNNGNILGCN